MAAMDIRGIKYFISAAECLNFTRAARECFITQTAMSQHIANMEKELGFQLFRRNNRNVELTPAGRDFYEQMKLVVHAYDNAVRHSQNLSSGGEGSIVIAMPSCIEGLTFMSRLRYFKSHYPSIHLTVMIVSPRYMVERLKRGECDIAISWPYDMVQADELTVQNIAEFKSLLVCASDHPLAGSKSVTPERLIEEHVALMDLQGMPATYRSMSKDWKRLGLLPPEAVTFQQINRMEELLFAVNIDPSVVALVPEFVQKNATGNMSFLELDMPAPPMFVLAAGYLTSNLNPALHLALDVLRDSRIPLDY